MAHGNFHAVAVPVLGEIGVTAQLMQLGLGEPETVDQHFDTSHMDALLVLQHGSVVYERYKTMRPFERKSR